MAEELAEALSVMLFATVAPFAGDVRFTVNPLGKGFTVTVAVLEALAPKLSVTVKVATKVPCDE